MNKSILFGLMVSLPACVGNPGDEPSEFVVEGVTHDEEGRPQFIEGSLGLELAPIAEAFNISAHDLVLVESQVDELGMKHDRYEQVRFGHPVVGGDLRVHSENGGIVAALAPAWPESFAVSDTASIGKEDAANAALVSTAGGTSIGDSSLVYVVPSDGSSQALAWQTQIVGERDDGLPVDDLVFVNAQSGEVIDRHPRVHTARNRQTSDANNTDSIVGTRVRSEGMASIGDAAVDAAHDNAGVTYDCYRELFGRDSYDNNGATLRSTAHHKVNYNNAFWNGSRMVYGDGDGSLMISLSLSQDVVTHELTHAVTEYTSGLVYQNESGALNEAWSDIFGSVCEIYNENGINNLTWVLGEDAWTPGVFGDGLRYMDNPTKDGSSTDFYPDRYKGAQDNGGVHWNSGIANLAFVLLVEGGTHPRGKTSLLVPSVGIQIAGQVFYRAGALYMGSTTNFAGARAATVRAAEDLYGSEEVYAVKAAWAAVGVGATPEPIDDGGQNDGDPTACSSDLVNGQTILVSGLQGQQLNYKLCIPSDATGVTVRTLSGTGDLDLYIRKDGAPSLETWDYRPFRWGNDETVSLPSGSSGDWFVMLNGYSSFQNAELLLSWQ